jgi:hypothetical protein
MKGARTDLKESGDLCGILGEVYLELHGARPMAELTKAEHRAWNAEAVARVKATGAWPASPFESTSSRTPGRILHRQGATPKVSNEAGQKARQAVRRAQDMDDLKRRAG